MTRFMHQLSGVAAAVSLACATAVFAQPATQNPAQTGTRNPAENTVSPSKEMTTPAGKSTGSRTGITSAADTTGASSGSSTSGAMTGSSSGSSGARGSAAAGGSSGSAGAAGSMASADRTFVTKAAQIGLAEVQTGELAKSKASSDQAKQFGDHMVTDHTKTNDQLKQIVSSKQMDLPTAPAAKDQATLKRLQGMSGAQFDRAYLDSQIAGHKEAISAFQSEARSGRDPELKAFATATLPNLQEHLRMATDASKTTKASSREKSGGSTSARASAAQ
jgi:putative membrane protein